MYSFNPIAHVQSTLNYRAEAPRQAVFSDIGAKIVFDDPHAMRETTDGLEGFARIWLIFCFHLNADKPWKRRVRPPYSPNDATFGVFATRSPYRPNPIGLSSVELLGLEKGSLFIGGCDLLDGTPIFDIKPYIPQADAFPNISAGWRDAQAQPNWHICYTPEAETKIAFLQDYANLNARHFCEVQLCHDPLDRRRKRITTLDSIAKHYALGLRTWRLCFELDDAAKCITIFDVRSNYPIEELNLGVSDPYADKAIHRSFNTTFNPHLN